MTLGAPILSAGTMLSPWWEDSRSPGAMAQAIRSPISETSSFCKDRKPYCGRGSDVEERPHWQAGV